MFNAVSPVFDEVRLEEFVFLRVDAVGERSRVGHGDFLIPPFITHHFLSSERIESGDRDIEVWQGHRYRRVTHVLREIGSRTERHTDAGECCTPVDGRGSSTLRHRLRIIE